MAAAVHEHRRQILRVASELRDIDENSADFGKSYIIPDFKDLIHGGCLLVEFLLLGGAAIEALAGGILSIILALGGIAMVLVHYFMMSFEHQRHDRHRLRVQTMENELRKKADELLEEAERQNIRPQRRSWRRWLLGNGQPPNRG
jgi:hypothetical protein